MRLHTAGVAVKLVPLRLTVLRILVGRFAAQMLRRRHAVVDPRGPAREVHDCCAGPLRQFRHDLDARRAVTDDGDAFVRIVELVVPGRRVDTLADVGVDAFDLGPFVGTVGEMSVLVDRLLMRDKGLVRTPILLARRSGLRRVLCAVRRRTRRSLPTGHLVLAIPPRALWCLDIHPSPDPISGPCF